MSGPGDTVRRGPERWMRAAVNSAKRPNSHGAKLYQHRLVNAIQIRDGLLASGKQDRPYEFMIPTLGYSASHGGWMQTGERRDYSTCSIFCTVMQIQLLHATTDLTEIDRVFNATPTKVYLGFRKIRPLEGTHRKMRCQVCATEVTQA